MQQLSQQSICCTCNSEQHTAVPTISTLCMQLSQQSPNCACSCPYHQHLEHAAVPTINTWSMHLSLPSTLGACICPYHQHLEHASVPTINTWSMHLSLPSTLGACICPYHQHLENASVPTINTWCMPQQSTSYSLSTLHTKPASPASGMDSICLHYTWFHPKGFHPVSPETVRRVGFNLAQIYLIFLWLYC